MTYVLPKKSHRRHCERSVAIQSGTHRRSGLPRRVAPRNDVCRVGRTENNLVRTRDCGTQ